MPYGLMFDQSEEGLAHAQDSINDVKPQKHNRRKSVKTMRYGGLPVNAGEKGVNIKVSGKDWRFYEAEMIW